LRSHRLSSTQNAVNACWLLGVAPLILLWLGVTPGGLVTVIASYVLMSILGAFFGQRVEIGAEGVRWHRLGKSRFLPCASITSVAAWSTERAHPQTGRPIRRLHGIVVSSPRGDWSIVTCESTVDGRPGKDHEALLADLRSLVAAKEDPAIAEASKVVAATTVARLPAGAREDFRAPDAPTETLWRVLESPIAEPRVRIAAALLLRREFDETGHARARRVLAATELPQLRVALETALDPTADEEDLAAVAEREDAEP
jgi:hypothetical protein